VKVPPSSTTPFAEDEFGARCTLARRPRMRPLVLERTVPKQAKATAAPKGTTLASIGEHGCVHGRILCREGTGPSDRLVCLQTRRKMAARYNAESFADADASN
jgi:hypothetical protein